MSKMLVLALTLLCSAAWLQAQDQNSQNPPDSSAPAASQTSVKGCLQGSDGNFTLTSDSGTTYSLQGDTSKLSDHVGHEVRITGTTANASSSNSNGSQPTLTVEKFKHISKTCNSMTK